MKKLKFSALALASLVALLSVPKTDGQKEKR